MTTLTPSAKCEAFIKGYEKCRLTAYLPTPKDVPTIGWGSTGPDVKLGMRWTQKKADDRFSSDLKLFASAVSSAVNGIATQNQFDAMVSLAYNIGRSAFANSTVARKHRAGDYAGAAEAFKLFNKQKGKVLNGLIKRRQAEKEIYES